MNDLASIKEHVKDLKVLFVDDEESLRLSTGRFLEKFFINVTLAENGEDGLEKFKEEQFDVVITDILMPKMSGPDMAAAISKISPETLIIFVTASREKDDYENVKNSLKVTKPLSYASLTQIMLKIEEYHKGK